MGSAQKQASLGDHGWKHPIERHHILVREALERWRGVRIDTVGDGFYASFDGPARAIRCAEDVCRRVRDLGIEVRAGVHTGECELINDKVGGIALSTARESGAGGAFTDLGLADREGLVAGSGFSFENAGLHELKGVPDPWHLYRAVSEEIRG